MAQKRRHFFMIAGASSLMRRFTPRLKQMRHEAASGWPIDMLTRQCENQQDLPTDQSLKRLFVLLINEKSQHVTIRT
jgi:hypothetical protein